MNNLMEAQQNNPPTQHTLPSDMVYTVLVVGPTYLLW